MIKFKELFFLFIFILTILIGRLSMANEDRDTIHMTLKDGIVVIETRPDLAPKHVSQIKQLISEGQYDGVVFHRVIDKFMAQTGDVEFGNSNSESYDPNRAGTGGSKYPNLKAEFSDVPHERGTLSMARSGHPDSANSQFFICFEAAPHLDRSYTVFGKVIKGMEFIDLIQKGEGSNGEVKKPDKIISLSAASQ